MNYPEKYTVCARDCYDTCSLIVDFDANGNPQTIKGDPQHPYTRGFSCPRGIKDLERMRTGRVEKPYMQNNGVLEAISWDSALHSVSEKLKETIKNHGAQAALYLTYAGNTGYLSQLYPQRLWNALGATQSDMALCSASGHKALGLHYGQSYGVHPEDLENMQMIIFWGFNAVVSSPHLWALASNARKKNAAKIIVIDARKSETAKQADLWIQPRPGSDVALAYGIMQQLIRKKQVDQAFISKWTTGFDALKKKATQWTPEKVYQVSGVSPHDLETLSNFYASLQPSATMIGIGLQKSDNGANQVRAVSMIPALLGLPRGFFYSNSGASNINHDIITGCSYLQKPRHIVEQVALSGAIQKGKYKFIYVSGMNPAVTLPNQPALRDGLRRSDVFVVVHETHHTKTTQFADIILPAATYLEKKDLVEPWSHNFIRISPQVVEPLTDSKTEVEVMQTIAKKLGRTESWLFTNPWEAVKKALENAIEENTYTQLEEGARLPLKRKPDLQYQTQSGKIEFFSSAAEQAGFSPLPQQIFLKQESDEFIYLTSASPTYTHSQFQSIYGLIPAVVHINFEDAQNLNIQQDQEIILYNETGEIKVKTSLSNDLPCGVLWSIHHFEGLIGKPLNQIMVDEPQEIGKGPRFNSTKVKIRND
ncbi:MAG: molybdopterin-dependent oxidoreductase [Anaerolineaceae bacterium]|nr:molybdopterin-dependent oxidoreductase [Anaerolineaceae bacterium]